MWHPFLVGWSCWQEAGLALIPWPALAVRMSLLCPCQVLADIEVAQSLQAQKVKEEEEEEEKKVPHPLDQDYALLCCQLSLLDPASQEYQVLLVSQCPIVGSNMSGLRAPQMFLLLQGHRGHC